MTRYKLVNGERVAFTADEEKARDAEEAIEAAKAAEEAKLLYQRQRTGEADTTKDIYPSIQEQLDMQYWDKKNGTTTWVDAITKTKTKYPKPE
tara:strand:- start:46 stop:324 length:279 start_codon:yes stop_codon:yes gene_type:complete